MYYIYCMSKWAYWMQPSCPPEIVFAPHFSNIVVLAESLGITTYLESVNGGMQGHAPCEILPFNQIPFFVSVKFHGNLKTVTKLREI